jgi:diguanylate cyclase (GGDEF)-like protein
MMRNPLRSSSLKGLALVASVALLVAVGVGAVLKATVDYLLYWDATAAAESWARYVVENVTDIEEIALGAQPSAASMAFFIRTQQIRYVFGFEIADLNGNVQLVSDGTKISGLRGAVRNDTAAHAAALGVPIVSVKEGLPPVRPQIYADAYLPVMVNGQPKAIVSAYVDLTEQRDHFRMAFLLAALALCLLGGAGAGLPTLAWHRMTKEKQRADRRVYYLAHHDGLTGLANRTHFLEKLDTALAALQPGSPCLALHFVDLDHFKDVNDTLGHDAGDFLLTTAAQRLRSVTRSSDAASRFGGDEFVVLQTGVHERAEAEDFALRLASAIAQPMLFGEHEIGVTVSLGFALAPEDAGAIDALLKCADLAVYQAKADGRNCVRGFLPSMDDALKARIELERTIRAAARDGKFVLHYQPIYEIAGRRLIGFEALLRLPAAGGALVAPSIFIPIAEELHLIDRIGNWVLREACMTAAEWPPHLTVSVNVSVAQFEAGGVSRDVRAALEDSGLAPQRLELEITENLLLKDSERVLAELHALKAMGVAVAIDDFGIGYSSLSYLWRFPFDKIKIDQSFLAGLDSGGDAAEAVMKTVIGLGRELNMRVTVEGVETDKHVLFLDEVGGDQAQGYYFGRPIPASDIPARILSDIRFVESKPQERGVMSNSSDEAAA